MELKKNDQKTLKDLNRFERVLTVAKRAHEIQSGLSQTLVSPQHPDEKATSLAVREYERLEDPAANPLETIEVNKDRMISLKSQ